MSHHCVGLTGHLQHSPRFPSPEWDFISSLCVRSCFVNFVIFVAFLCIIISGMEALLGLKIQGYTDGLLWCVKMWPERFGLIETRGFVVPGAWVQAGGGSVHVWGHDDVIKWKRFPRYWRFVREIHRFPVNSQHKIQWRGALIFSLICTRINGWVNNGEAGDLRRNRAHYDVTVMSSQWCQIAFCAR